MGQVKILEAGPPAQGTPPAISNQYSLLPPEAAGPTSTSFPQRLYLCLLAWRAGSSSLSDSSMFYPQVAFYFISFHEDILIC